MNLSRVAVCGNGHAANDIEIAQRDRTYDPATLIFRFRHPGPKTINRFEASKTLVRLIHPLVVSCTTQYHIDHVARSAIQMIALQKYFYRGFELKVRHK